MRLELGNRVKFWRDYFNLKRQGKKSSEYFSYGKFYPCLRDWQESSGSASGHYFHQDLFVAQKIYQHNPKKHVDVGSRIDGFVAHVAVFRKIEVFDVRPLECSYANIVFKQVDFMRDCSDLTGYCDSLSCLHALEHFGLGRYGDAVDYEGHIKGFENLTTILKRGGKLYFSVPIGPQRIEFNAHRVFDLRYLVHLCENKFRIDSFAYVDDKGDLHQNVVLEGAGYEKNFMCAYGCGIFELTKIAD